MHINSVTFHPERYPTKKVYPFSLPIFHKTKTINFDLPITIFVGENGTGKSTLLEAITLACGIHIWRQTERGSPQHNPYEDQLCKYITVEWQDGRVPGSFFSSKIFQHFAELLDEWAAADRGQLDYFGGKSLTAQSHGQSLMSFFENRYQIKGLYLMDEPETALSPQSQIQLLSLLNKMSTAGHAQFIFATHSPILLACSNAKLYSFDDAEVHSISYESTNHYRLYKLFLENKNDFLNTKNNK